MPEYSLIFRKLKEEKIEFATDKKILFEKSEDIERELVIELLRFPASGSKGL